MVGVLRHLKLGFVRTSADTLKSFQREDIETSPTENGNSWEPTKADITIMGL